MANDDFDVLQDNTYAAIYATLQGAAPMVLSGCRIINRVYDQAANTTIGDVEPGMIWLGNNIHFYEGAAQQLLPIEIAAGGYIDSDERAYQTGGSKPCMYEREILTQPKGTAPAGSAIVSGAIAFERTYAKWLESQTRTIGEVQWLTNHTAFQYDGTGRGWADQPGAGWALCNGQNGTADLRERFIVGMAPGNQDYSAPRKVGGSAQVVLSTDQLPAHSHTMETAGRHTHGLKNWQLNKKADRSDQEWVPDPGIRNINFNTEPAGEHTHTINETGSGAAHENRPPFFVLVAREWVGV